MTKFNTTDKRAPRTVAPIKANPVATGHTYNGAAGYEYDTLSQLFLLACSNMVGEKTFYEDPQTRDARYVQLIEKAVIEGHIDWLNRFFPWLRNNANMRTAAVIGAAEAVRAMAAVGIPGGRSLVNSVLTRADEPGEMLAYWMSTYGRSIPKPIKRGVADAAGRLYTQRNAIKYDTDSKGLRFGDVLELVHPGPGSYEQGDLFKWLVTRAHKRDLVEYAHTLPMLQANALLRRDAARDPRVLLNTARLRQAGMTWENVLSLAGDKVGKKDLWEAMIPEMGYMALLRNLRNFDESGVKGDTYELIKQKLTDPDEVARSRQLPMRFLSAYRNVPSDRWKQALEEALQLCLRNVPEFAGSTLILIDTSGSMTGQMSGRSQLQLQDAATIFGLALAARCENATVVTYSGTSREFPQVKGESLLRSIDRFSKDYFYGGGTDTAGAVRRHHTGQDRTIILTDEQADPNAGVFTAVSPNRMGVTFNLAGYRHAHAATGPNRVAVGGLSDAAFTLLHSLDSRRASVWPF